MIDNFEIIKPLLSFEPDEFYFVQIFQRKKDNPNGEFGSNNSSRLIKAYYITSIQQLDDLKEEMIFFATHFNARVGINLNKRSFYKTAFNTLEKISNLMANKNFKDVRRAWNTSCGKHNGGDRLWILDIDESEISPIMCSFIENQQPCKKALYENEFGEEKVFSKFKNQKLIAQIPSKNGWHLITKPFDTRYFHKEYSKIEIHKNNPTNLLIP